MVSKPTHTQGNNTSNDPDTQISFEEMRSIRSIVREIRTSAARMSVCRFTPSHTEHRSQQPRHTALSNATKNGKQDGRANTPLVGEGPPAGMDSWATFTTI